MNYKIENTNKRMEKLNIQEYGLTNPTSWICSLVLMAEGILVLQIKETYY